MGNCIDCRYAIRDPLWTDYKCSLKRVDIPEPEEMGCGSYIKDTKKSPPSPPGRRPPRQKKLYRPGDKTIVENGTFYAEGDGMTGYRSVTVKVPDPVIRKKVITKNGVYTPEDDIAGFGPVVVNVEPVLQEKTINVYESGDYTVVAEPSFDGLIRIKVHVNFENAVTGYARVGYAIVGGE